MKFALTLMAAPLLMMGGNALAQEAPPAQQAPTQQPPAATQEAAPVSEEEVDRFALAALMVEQIAADPEMDQQQQQNAMASAVQQAGLQPERYNQIAQASQSDADLQEKIELAAMQHVEAAQQNQ